MPDPTPKAAPEPAAPAVDLAKRDAELAAAIALANQRASEADQRSRVAEQRANQVSLQAAAAQAPRQPDILDKYVSEDLVMSPDEKKRVLSAAIEQRAREQARQMAVEMDRRNAQEREAMRAEMALNMVLSQNPELQQNPSNFAAAMTKVKFDAEARGIQLSPAQLAQSAAEEYKKIWKPSQPLPHVEGGNHPNMGTGLEGQPPAPAGASQLENWYGMKPGQIKEGSPMSDAQTLTDLNMAYVLTKNKPLFDAGARSNMQEINRVISG